MGADDWRAIGVVVALCGTALNGFFNFRNWSRTDSAARCAIAVEAFRSSTSVPIQAALSKFHSIPRQLRAAVEGASGIEDRKQRVRDVQNDCSGMYMDLSFHLETASGDANVVGNDWREAIEPCWDEFLGALDTIMRDDSPDDRIKQGMQRAEQSVSRICTTINQKLQNCHRRIVEQTK